MVNKAPSSAKGACAATSVVLEVAKAGAVHDQQYRLRRLDCKKAAAIRSNTFATNSSLETPRSCARAMRPGKDWFLRRGRRLHLCQTLNQRDALLAGVDHVHRLALSTPCFV